MKYNQYERIKYGVLAEDVFIYRLGEKEREERREREGEGGRGRGREGARERGERGRGEREKINLFVTKLQNGNKKTIQNTYSR